MTDKEKIELIIQEKHLTNTQFCNEVCIAPGTLSHILSGRTQPTLNILRSITQAFSDINPAWLFYDEEPMYKNSDSPTPENDESDATYLNSSVEDSLSPEDDLPLFAAANQSSSARNAVNSRGTSPAMSSQGVGTVRRTASQAPVAAASLNVQDIVAETLKQQQKPPRKVVEVRIFFDDGTFETFSAN